MAFIFLNVYLNTPFGNILSNWILSFLKHRVGKEKQSSKKWTQAQEKGYHSNCLFTTGHLKKKKKTHLLQGN